jgi:hypothetical protein
MSLVIIKDSLKIVEKINLYSCGGSTTSIIQGDAKSNRIYKMLRVIRNQGRKMVVYTRAKYEGGYLRETYITKVIKEGGKTLIRDWIRMRWDAQEEIMAYGDSKGNHWIREWGVAFPYDLSDLITCRKEDVRVSMWEQNYEGGLRVRQYSDQLDNIWNMRHTTQSNIWDDSLKQGFLSRDLTYF